MRFRLLKFIKSYLRSGKTGDVALSVTCRAWQFKGANNLEVRQERF